MTLALLALTGLFAGFVGGVLGLGGGLIIVPALTLLAGLPIHSAIAASLVCAIATSSGAAPSNLKRGYVNLSLSMRLEFWTIAGAILGGLLGHTLSGDALGRVFGAVMGIMAIVMLRRTEPASAQQIASGAFTSSYFDGASGETVGYSVRNLRGAYGVSSFAGVLSGLLGIGGGIIQVPMLSMMAGLPMKAATATSGYMLGTTAAAGAMVYYGIGHLDAAVTAPVAIGVLVGSRLAAMTYSRLRSESLQRIFALVMMIIAVRMLVGGDR